MSKSKNGPVRSIQSRSLAEPQNRFGMEWVRINQPSSAHNATPVVERHRRLNLWASLYEETKGNIPALKERLGEESKDVYNEAYRWWMAGRLPEDLVPPKWGSGKRRTKQELLEDLDAAHKLVHKGHVDVEGVQEGEPGTGKTIGSGILQEVDAINNKLIDVEQEVTSLRNILGEADLPHLLREVESLKDWVKHRQDQGEVTDILERIEANAQAIGGHKHPGYALGSHIHSITTYEMGHTHTNPVAFLFGGIWRRIRAVGRAITKGE